MQPAEELANLARDRPALAFGAILFDAGLIALLLPVVKSRNSKYRFAGCQGSWEPRTPRHD